MTDSKTGNAALVQQQPDTVEDLIALLQSLPSDRRISFAPFNLQRIHDDGQVVHFDMQEIEGVHYTRMKNLDG